jgi:hypothetical protein
MTMKRSEHRKAARTIENDLEASAHGDFDDEFDFIRIVKESIIKFADFFK